MENIPPKIYLIYLAHNNSKTLRMLLKSSYKETAESLDTLKVKEVNLEKELDEWIKYGPHTNYPWCTIPYAIKITAEHFFELGLQAQRGE